MLQRLLKHILPVDFLPVLSSHDGYCSLQQSVLL